MDSFIPHADLDRHSWIERWDRMQDSYLVKRHERFEIIARIIRDTQDAAPRILDLGCGTGTLSLFLLETLPGSFLCGVDLDPTLLLLANTRLNRFGSRVSLLHADIRGDSWERVVPAPFDAVVSAMALHWLDPHQLAALYGRLPGLLKPGGLFLNADHVGSDSALVQESWSGIRQEALTGRTGNPPVDDWKGFWDSYLDALGPDSRRIRDKALGEWGGIEDGMPLLWHLDHLRTCGFLAVDCFWRFGGDAIYGGVLSENGRRNAPAD
jgi:SAM-dependent methyltransferase